MKKHWIFGSKTPTNRVVEGKTRYVQIAQKSPEKMGQSAQKTVKNAANWLAVHTGVQGGVQNDKRRKGY